MQKNKCVELSLLEKLNIKEISLFKKNVNEISLLEKLNVKEISLMEKQNKCE